jgi:hypothetical protein
MVVAHLSLAGHEGMREVVAKNQRKSEETDCKTMSYVEERIPHEKECQRKTGVYERQQQEPDGAVQQLLLFRGRGLRTL